MKTVGTRLTAAEAARLTPAEALRRACILHGLVRTAEDRFRLNELRRRRAVQGRA